MWQDDVNDNGLWGCHRTQGMAYAYGFLVSQDCALLRGTSYAYLSQSAEKSGLPSACKAHISVFHNLNKPLWLEGTSAHFWQKLEPYTHKKKWGCRLCWPVRYSPRSLSVNGSHWRDCTPWRLPWLAVCLWFPHLVFWELRFSRQKKKVESSLILFLIFVFLVLFLFLFANNSIVLLPMNKMSGKLKRFCLQ